MAHSIHHVVSSARRGGAATVYMIRICCHGRFRVTSVGNCIKGAGRGVVFVTVSIADLQGTIFVGAVRTSAAFVATGCGQAAVRQIKDGRMLAVARHVRP